MGYYSDWEGEITITPPIPWKDIKDSHFRPTPAYQSQVNLQFSVTEEAKELEEGTFYRKVATAVVVSHPSESKNYYVTQNLQEILNAHPGHQFTGYFEAVGEDGERWRVVITSDRIATEIKPELVWPEVP